MSDYKFSREVRFNPPTCTHKRMAGSALRRLMAEYKQLSQNPPDGTYFTLKS